MQEIDLNKATWSALFEPFHFFEAYRKFLVVDIVAEDDDDLRLWKGWVESRLRQLTLKVRFVLLISVQCSHVLNCCYFSWLKTKHGHVRYFTANKNFLMVFVHLKCRLNGILKEFCSAILTHVSIQILQ